MHLFFLQVARKVRYYFLRFPKIETNTVFLSLSSLLGLYLSWYLFMHVRVAFIMHCTHVNYNLSKQNHDNKQMWRM